MTGRADSLTRLVIVGAGGHGRETLDIVNAINVVRPGFEFLGFLDDNMIDDEVIRRRALLVLGATATLAHHDGSYVIAIGAPQTRRRIASLVTGKASAATLVHPSVVMGTDVDLGPGVIVAAGVHITTNVRIGCHSHLNVAATVAHDCRIGDYVSLSPGVHVSGNVSLGDGAFLGAGAVITPGCRVGSSARIGAGAVVVSDVPPGVTVIGVPARPVAHA